MTSNDRLRRGLAQSLAVYSGFAVVALTLLCYHPVRLIDGEELDYGELAVALIDGLVTRENLVSFQTFAREGSLLLWAPTTAAVFGLMGSSLFSLKVSAILIASFWALAWYWIGRLALPRAPPLLVGLAFVFPAPLVQISSISTTSVMAHFGTSLWHGVALLSTCVAVSRGGSRARRAAALGGLASGLGLYCSYSLLPLLPGVVWTFARCQRAHLLRPFAFGSLPGLALVASFLADTSLTSIERAVPAGFYPMELLHKLIVYGAGIYVGPPNVLPGISAFSAAAIAYPALLALVTAAAWWPRRTAALPDGLERGVGEGLLISALGMLGALWLTRYTIDLWAFDGLRYFLPLVAPTTLLFLAAAIRLPGAGTHLALWTFVSFNVGAFISLVSVGERADFLHHTRGYRGSFFLHARQSQPLLDLAVPKQRAEHYALWMGTADTLRGELDIAKASQHSAFASATARDEYWRGVGLGRAVADPGCFGSRECVPLGVSLDLAPRVWEGLGLGSECDNWRRRVATVAEPMRSPFLWGLGRGSYHDCEDWPRDPAFAAGGATSIVERYSLFGHDAALAASAAERPLPLYATGELAETADRLLDWNERIKWWLR